MANVVRLWFTEATEDELWRHGLRLKDAIDVLDGGDYRTFVDHSRPPRRYMIGRSRGGRLLTLVIEPADDTGGCLLITGWPSNKAETTLYSRPGGSNDAGKPAKTSN